LARAGRRFGSRGLGRFRRWRFRSVVAFEGEELGANRDRVTGTNMNRDHATRHIAGNLGRGLVRFNLHQSLTFFDMLSLADKDRKYVARFNPITKYRKSNLSCHVNLF
jgi:hypothetical protein